MEIRSICAKICLSSVLNNGSQRETFPKKDLSFKSYEPAKSREIAKELQRCYGIKCDFDNNGFVAECIQKITRIFSNLFSNSSLPERVTYKRFYNQATRAAYNSSWNEVTINKDLDNTWYNNIDSLTSSMKEDQHFLLPDWSSSRHSAHVFAHEYSHSAHWHHLESRNGRSNANKVWSGLVGTRIPSAIGRLIARYKISDYAVGTKNNCDMCEFLAERMAQDVCNGLSLSFWSEINHIDVNYDNIFDRKWNYRYSSPQSYIDYFTQQVWNGDISGAEAVGRAAGEYLSRINAEPVAVPVAQLETKTKGTILEKIGSKIFNINSSITSILDKRNDLRLNLNY